MNDLTKEATKRVRKIEFRRQFKYDVMAILIALIVTTALFVTLTY